MSTNAFLTRILSAKKKRGGSRKDRSRRLRLESLEDRRLLAASVSGSLYLGADTANIPIRNAMVEVQIPILQTVGGSITHTTTKRTGFTSSTGAYSALDSADGDQLDPAGQIQVTVFARSPSIAANDPDDTTPAYSVVVDLAVGPVYSARLKIGAAHSANANATVSAGDPAYDAFLAFTTLFTYWTFTNQDLGIVPGTQRGVNLTDPVTIAFSSTEVSHFDRVHYQITLNDYVFTEVDAKVLGHEYGHYVAKETGWLNGPTKVTHNFLANQRLKSTPAQTEESYKRRPATFLCGGVCELVCNLRGISTPPTPRH